MQNYLDLITEILEIGIDKDDRTGIGSRSIFGAMLRWDLAEGFPLVNVRKTPFRLVFEETMFFLRGETDTKKLEEKNVNIWKGNTTREFLDSRNLNYLPEGDMGKGYGFQWRDFGGDYTPGVDQINGLIKDLKENPYSRRHIVTAWNPQQLHETALPPCHILHQYQVMDGKLNSSFYMRSNDVYLGLPFNIAGYAFLNHVFAKATGLEPGELVYFGGDVHLYKNQLDAAKIISSRTPLPLPTLEIHKNLNTLDDILNLEYEDISVVNYYYDDTLLPEVKMAV